MMMYGWLFSGAVSAFIGVALGAFGAHGLVNRVEAPMLEVWKTASQYQMYHALALVALGLWQIVYPSVSGSAAYNIAGWGFLIGTLLFCGSLYAMVLSGVRVLGAITPLGGVGFLVGWAALAWLAFRTGATASG